MKKHFCARSFALLCCMATMFVGQTVSADVLWNNGPIVTHAGAGPGGVDVSMASLVPNTGGPNVTAGGWRADNFTVGGAGWLVGSIQTYAYDTSNPDPRFGVATIRIHENSGGSPGEVLVSAAANWAYSGINRVFNGVGNLSNTARQLQLLTADFGDFHLAAGDYFFSFSVSNTAPTATNNWLPMVMDINPDNPDDPITRVGNSFYSGTSGASWASAIVATGDWNQAPEIAFTINGTAIPEPTSALLCAGLLFGFAGLRRRQA